MMRHDSGSQARRIIADDHPAYPDQSGDPAMLSCTGPDVPVSAIDPSLDWIEIILVDPLGRPVKGERWLVQAPDGQEYTGVLDETGFARVDGIVPGMARVTFPDLDRRAWHPI